MLKGFTTNLKGINSHINPLHVGHKYHHATNYIHMYALLYFRLVGTGETFVGRQTPLKFTKPILNLKKPAAWQVGNEERIYKNPLHTQTENSLRDGHLISSLCRGDYFRLCCHLFSTP